MRRISLVCYAGLAWGVMIGGYFFARLQSDPHLMNRVGATVAAMGALFVVLQVAIEFHDGSETSVKRQEVIRLRDEIGQSLRHEPSAAVEILRVELRRIENELFRGRLEIAFVVGILTCIGELIHGWGDIAIR